MPRTKGTGAGTFCSKVSTPKSISYTTQMLSNRRDEPANSRSIASFAWKRGFSNKSHRSRFQTMETQARFWKIPCFSNAKHKSASNAGWWETKMPGEGGSASTTQNWEPQLKKKECGGQRKNERRGIRRAKS